VKPVSTLGPEHNVRDSTAQGGRASGVPTVQLDAPAATHIGWDEHQTLLEAGREIEECYRVLEKAELNVVADVLRGEGEFVEMEHYPHEDALDPETQSQYYYHAHRGDPNEHGHFHTFIRTGALPRPLRPPTRQVAAGPQGADAIVHLVGISMDDWGYPRGLFCTNRWVCGETWYPAASLIDLLPHFIMDHAYPSWPANRWITALLRLFAPHVRVLLRHRDATVKTWQRAIPKLDVLEDRRLEITGYLPISVHDWLAQLNDTSSD